MLSEEKNRLLTRVGPGTPMGDLLRRYWQPVAGASEFDKTAIRPIRLFGEDLVLYKDRGGRYGLVDRQCCHRRADLSYGWVEACGIRCNYHGWLYDERGRCIEMPYDDTAHPQTKLKEQVKLRAYPVKELAGMLWVYMGPEPVPELPVWDAFLRKNGFAEVVLSDVPCNWLQCQENSCDPVHFEWMHDNWSLQQRGGDGPTPTKHLKVDFGEFEFGFVYKRIREGQKDADPLWTVGRVTLWPNGFYLGDHFEWRVPIDDENTLSVGWFWTRVPKGREPYVQNAIPTWHGPVRDENGRWITSHVMNQDFVAWVGQGAIADRSREFLAASDGGIVMMRRQLFRDLDAIAAGRDPKGVIRDGERAKSVALPNVNETLVRDGLAIEDWAKHPIYRERLKRFRWQAGQPQDVWNAYAAAMGFTS
jgi:5,5'-dehydrodivanillate O-demethylase oxygenase subunit